MNAIAARLVTQTIGQVHVQADEGRSVDVLIKLPGLLNRGMLCGLSIIHVDMYHVVWSVCLKVPTPTPAPPAKIPWRFAAILISPK